jgi:2-hydroxychromene-2-carboxylate isomerase
LSAERALFYFDVGSPYAYLTAERISAVFAEAGLAQPEWRPILLGGLFQRFDRDSWANGPGRAEGIADVERRASEYGLPPLAWPDPWPGNTLFAMRAATFAKQTGRTVSFALPPSARPSPRGAT